jgi:P27 family predicted phage terminase small subunit
MRGRKPKPTHLKLIEGNRGRRPLPTGEPKPAPALPDAPAHLTPEAREEWDRVAGNLYQLGLLTTIDRGALAAVCQAYGRWVQAERLLKDSNSSLLIMGSRGRLIRNPLIGVANTAMADYVRYCAEFGMTPSSRSRIHAAEKPQVQDPAEAYLA